MASTLPNLTSEQLNELEEQKIETREIIQQLLDDGSLPDALYIIEHHFSSEDFDVLEKLAVEAFKLDYEVSDAEELEDEEGELFFSCDVVCEMHLQAEKIDEQCELMFKLANKFGVSYDGWGTYFEDGSDEEHGVIFED